MASRTFDIPFDLYEKPTKFGDASALTWNTSVVKSAGSNDVQASIYTLGRLVILQFGCRIIPHDDTVPDPTVVAWLPKELMPYDISRSICCDNQGNNVDGVSRIRYCGVSTASTTEHPYGTLYVNAPYWSSNNYMFGEIVYFRRNI